MCQNIRCDVFFTEFTSKDQGPNVFALLARDLNVSGFRSIAAAAANGDEMSTTAIEPSAPSLERV